MELVSNDVSNVYADGLMYLRVAGVAESSRNGPVIVAPEPVTLTCTNPTKRVLFSPLRDANPIFHLMEALGFLAGRNDIEWYAQFASNMRNYSDDGKILWGSYGYRWRKYFSHDQLEWIVGELKANPDSRRAVLGMWDAINDPPKARAGGKDVPCNVTAMFDLRSGKLNMTVINRSNDFIWGLAGANFVHFTILQEYIAAWLNKPVGLFRTFTNNMHLYPANFPHELFVAAEDAKRHDYYEYFDTCNPHPLVNSYITRWEDDLEHFMLNPLQKGLYNDTFFSTVAAPMYWAWHVRKEKQGTGLEEAQAIAAPDWRLACTQWIERREAKRAQTA